MTMTRSKWFFPHQGLICAAEDGRDSCQAGHEYITDANDDKYDDDDEYKDLIFDQGDSGGPLIATAARHSNSTQKRWKMKKKKNISLSIC